MKVEIYGCDVSATLETIELPVSEVLAFVNLVKSFGFEDGDGEEYKFNSAKICEGGFVVYVEHA